MIPSAPPIKLIHVSAFDGSRSLWSRWIKHASEYRSLQKRLQMPSGNPHCNRHNRPEMVSRAHILRQCQHCVSALFRRLAISPLPAASAPFFAPARRIRPFLSPPPSPFLCARAPHPPFSLPPSLPPSAHHASRAAPTFLFFSRCVPRPSPFPFPPPQPQPGCSLISFSFLEASIGLRCRPPPARGGAPGAVRVCLADHCLTLRTIRQR